MKGGDRGWRRFFFVLRAGRLPSPSALRPRTDEGAGKQAPKVDSFVRCGHNDYMAITVVGARELKTRLGSYLQRVREGRTLVVTDRGQPVAELRPVPSDASLPALLNR